MFIFCKRKTGQNKGSRKNKNKTGSCHVKIYTFGKKYGWTFATPQPNKIPVGSINRVFVEIYKKENVENVERFSK